MSKDVSIDGGESPPQVPPALATAIAHLQAGDARAALQAASDACHAAPGLPAAHYAYGQAWAALGETGRAERAFAAAIRLAPRWADAWINYGLARYRQGAIEDAKAAMRRALGLCAGPSRRDLAISAPSCASAGERGVRRGAAARADRAPARRMPARGSTWRPTCCRKSARREALALSRERGGAARDPNAYAASGILQRALALLQLRRAAEAREALDGLEARGPLPPALAPLRHWRRVAAGHLQQATRRARREAATDGGRRSRSWGRRRFPNTAIMAHFDLAKFWSGQGEPSPRLRPLEGGATRCSSAASRSRAMRTGPSSTPISRIRRGPASRSGPSAGNADPAPVFIVGMPRSGTTLCEQILAAHRDAHGAGERSALGAPSPGSAALTRRTAVRAHRRPRCRRRSTRRPTRYLAELHALAPDKARIVDKMPGNYLLSRPRRPDAAGRQDHPLRARPARHRAVDLHLPLPRPSRLCARPRRSRLDHRRSITGSWTIGRRRCRTRS